ncbi:hypothetical protein WJ12_23535 [Burkholderia seminalis]|nr:hypothetical protein WJ12_23535 [Burkholderia seminalis]RQS84845.1 hypothetical protein DF032_00080 [Burkholderia seminalis]RQS91681.1 hypothetical protein DF048_19265 [Burkholderia seminalis]
MFWMENSPLDPVETRYEAAKHAPADAIRTVTGRVRRHAIHQTNRTIWHARMPVSQEDAGWDIGFR